MLNQWLPFNTVRHASTICYVFGNANGSKLNAYGVGVSTPETL